MKKSLFFALALLLACGTSHASEKIRIGLMGPMTGSWASEGAEMNQVLNLLADDLNARDGIPGKTVEIVMADDGGNPRTAALAAQRLATQGIVAVIGTYGSAVTEATQNIFDENRIIQVANGSTAIRLSEKGLPYFFRTCPRDDEQARVAVQSIEDRGVERLAILHDSSTYARGLADEARQLLAGNPDIEIVFFDALTPREQDYTAILTQMRRSSPDLVFFTGYYGEAGLLLRQKRDMNWDVPFMGGDATNNPDLVKTAGVAAASGFYFLSAPLPQDLPGEETKAFLESFSQRYGNPPNSIYAVLAGDGFRVVTEAIARTNSTDADEVSDYLRNELKGFPGLTGEISFNEKGDRVGEVYRLYRVDDEGQFILQP